MFSGFASKYYNDFRSMLFWIRLHCFLLTGFLYSRLITTSWPASVRFWLSSCPRPLQRSFRYSTRLLRWSIFPASATFAVWPLSASSSSYQSRQSRLPNVAICFLNSVGLVFRPLSASFSASTDLDFCLCRPCFWPRLFFDFHLGC